MTVCVRDLQYSALCLPCITAQTWLDMILYHDICKIIIIPLNNQAIKADKLCYQYGFFMPSTLI